MNAEDARKQLENSMSAAESGLRDTDYSAEMAKYTNKANREQAATNVLGEANKNAREISALLKG
jgi:flagellin-like hook-associated protein FlgL